MRTTIDLAPDVLEAVGNLARRENKSIGSVLSELARQALRDGNAAVPGYEPSASFHGFDPFPPRGAVVGEEAIDRLRDRKGV